MYRTIPINKTNTLMIAHRGLSGLEQENTCAAFVAAGNRSYYAKNEAQGECLDCG